MSRRVSVSELAVRLQDGSVRKTDVYVERADILHHDGVGLMRVTCLPASAPARGTAIVICPSLFEITVLMRSEISFARRAAAAGFTVSYVQPSGWGDSEGGDEGTFADRVAAALTAGEDLRRRGARDLCFLGGRVGGAVALAAAGESGETSVVLWDPVLDADAYWTQVRRLARVTAVRGRRRSFIDLDRQLSEQGWTSLLGHRITDAMLTDLRAGIESACDVRLTAASLCLVMNERSARRVRSRLGEGAELVVETLREPDRASLGLRRGVEAISPSLAWVEGHLE